MFRSRIELELQEDYERRSDKTIAGLQRAYNFYWDLREGFNLKIFDYLVREADREWLKVSNEGIGRKRFFRVAGPLRIPLTSVPPQV